MDKKSHPNVIRTWLTGARRRKQAGTRETVPREYHDTWLIRKLPPHNKT